MTYNILKIANMFDPNGEDSQKRDAFRRNFPIPEDYCVKADGVRAFLQNYPVTDGRKYGIMVSGKIVEDDDHLIELLGDQDDITLEFRHINWEPGEADEEAYQWLLQFAEPV